MFPTGHENIFQCERTSLPWSQSNRKCLCRYSLNLPFKCSGEDEAIKKQDDTMASFPFELFGGDKKKKKKHVWLKAMHLCLSLVMYSRIYTQEARKAANRTVSLGHLHSQTHPASSQALSFSCFLTSFSFLHVCHVAVFEFWLRCSVSFLSIFPASILSPGPLCALGWRPSQPLPGWGIPPSSLLQGSRDAL